MSADQTQAGPVIAWLTSSLKQPSW